MSNVPPCCTKGHPLTDGNVSIYTLASGRTRWCCLTCQRGWAKTHRDNWSEERREREKTRSRNRQKNLTPEQRAAKRAADARYRRKRGQTKMDFDRSAFMSKLWAERRASRPAVVKVEKPKIPFEIHQAWSRAKPGSIIRRLFPSPKDLKNAVWDAERQTLRRAA